MTTATRRRARKQPAEVRREEILAAAIRVFARQSYRAAGTADIAREAGVAEPTIYRHFDSKRDLYLAALAECGRLIAEPFRAIAAEVTNGAEALQAMGEWYEQAMQNDPDHLRLRMRAIAETEDPGVRDCLQHAYMDIIDTFTDVVRRGQGQGVINPSVSPVGAAWMFTAVGTAFDLARLMGLKVSECEGPFQDLSDTMNQVLAVRPA